ncbi:MAG: hypothetical protein KA368_09885 [Acidobacteria bacterium]|nr:hypothetical protein [Acidobacteriota bacterium]
MGPFSINEPQVKQTITTWFADTAELFVERYLPHSGSGGDFMIIRSIPEFNHLTEHAQPDSVIFVSCQNMLPLRGIVNDDFIDEAKTMFAEGPDFVVVKPAYYPDRFTQIESGNTHHELQNILNGFIGQLVWIGLDFKFPDFYWQPDYTVDAIIIRKPDE